MLSNTPAGCNSNGFALFVNTFGSADGSLHLNTGNGSSCLEATSRGGATLPEGVWSRIAVTADRPNKRAFIYLNGAVASATSSTTWGDYSTSGTLRLGNPGEQRKLQFLGAVQDVRVFGYALSLAEVTAFVYARNSTTAGDHVGLKRRRCPIGHCNWLMGLDLRFQPRG